MLNTLFNTLAYQQPAASQSYLFWGSWLAHIAASLTDTQDANGADRPRPVHGQLPAAEPVRGHARSRQPGARRRCSTCSTRPTGRRSSPPFCPAAVPLPMNKLRPQRARDPDDGRVRRLVRRAAAVPVDLVRRLGAARAAGLPVQRRVQPGRRSSAPRPTSGSPASSIGKVVSVGLDRHTGLTQAVIQIDRQFAPRPADTRAILRQKTLLGETYVELSPGNPSGPKLPDGGRSRRPRSRRPSSSTRSSPRSTRRPGGRSRPGCSRTGSRSPTAARTSTRRSPSCIPFATNVDSVLTVLQPRQRGDHARCCTTAARCSRRSAARRRSCRAFVRNSNAAVRRHRRRRTARWRRRSRRSRPSCRDARDDRPGRHASRPPPSR